MARTTSSGITALMMLLSWGLASAATDWSTQDYDLYPGDFNGDGKTDLLYIAKSPDKSSGIVLSDGSGPNTPFQTWSSTYLGINWSGNQYNPVIADFNADGRADLLLQSRQSGDSYLILANSQGLLLGVSQTIASTLFGMGWSGDQHRIVTGDFDGNGRADLFLQATSAAGNHYVIYPDSSGQFTTTYTQQWTDSTNSPGGLAWSTTRAIVYVGDFNGDHRADLLVQARPRFVTIDYDVDIPIPTYPANMNGVAWGQAGSTPFCTALGCSQTWDRKVNGTDWSPLNSTVVIGDFNNDGADDVILQARLTGQTSYMVLGAASGSVFVATPTAMASNVNWAADVTRLIAGRFTGSTGASGIYFQAKVASGQNAYANAVTGASVTTTTQGSDQIGGTVPATAAGRTAGSFGVSPTGASNYNIPIALPPGPRGVQPSLALTYSSQGGAGTVGPGWALSGLSSIARCNKTFAQDGAPSEVKLQQSDGYCLDGNRLKLTSGTYGADGSAYQTELADFSRVTMHGTATDSATVQNGPAWFEVWGKDGRIYQYGNTGDADNSANNSRNYANGTSTATHWLLNKVIDRSGNKYVVTYSTGATGSVGVRVPSSLAYTATSSGGTTYQYGITLTYAANSDAGAVMGYIAGSQYKNTSLLTGITVAYSGSTVRKYTLAYQTSPASGRRRLSAVQECAGTSAADCLRPTLISYQDGASDLSNQASTAVTCNCDVLGARDFNGDGKDDLLVRDRSSNILSVSFSNGSSYGSLAALKDPTNTTSVTYTTPAVTGMFVSFADMVATGRTDILVPYSGTWLRFAWNGSAMVSVSTGMSLSGNAQGFWKDVDGDGLPDYIRTAFTASAYNIFVRLNNSTAGSFSLASTESTAWTTSYDTCGGTCTRYYWLIADSFGTSTSATAKGVDFNGDGRNDLIFEQTVCYPAYPSTPCGSGSNILTSLGTTFSSGTWSAGQYDTGRFVDLNDDRCTDVLFSTALYTSLCNAAGTVSSTVSGTVIGVTAWNGDGRQDLILSNGGNFAVSASTGSGFSGTVTSGVAVPNGAFTFDVDGDGVPEVGVPGASSVAYYARGSSAGGAADTLASVTDGYGLVNTATYVATSKSNYTAGSAVSYPRQAVTGPVTVVASASASDGVGGTFTTTYSYTGAAQDVQGRGFLGFQAVQVNDSRSGTSVVKTQYSTTFPNAGMVAQRNVYRNNGTTPISQVVNTLTALTLNGTAPYQRYFPYASDVATDSYEVGGTKGGSLLTQSAMHLTYDNYGNVTGSTSTTTDKDSGSPASPTYNKSWTTAVTNTFSTDPSRVNNWCLGIPTETQATYSSTVVNESSVTRTTDFTPDHTKCRVTQSIVEPGSAAYKVTTDYIYDDDAGQAAPDFGNVVSTSVTGISMAARTKQTAWTSTGQFPSAVTDAVGQVVRYDYDLRFGVVKCQSDPNDTNSVCGVGSNLITTQWSYDTLGRKILETRADNTSTEYSYALCTPDNCVNGDPSSAATSINKMIVTTTMKDASSGTVRDDKAYLDQFGRSLVTLNKTLAGGYTRVGTQYDSLGHMYRQTLPCDAGNCVVYWVTNGYDDAGRLTSSSRQVSATDTSAQSTTVQYLGMSTITTDAQFKTSTQVVDPNGRARLSSDHNGYGQSFEYDAFGSLKKVTDSLGNALFSANYDYGIAAFQTGTTDLDLGSWGLTPNALGEVTAYTDAKGSQFTATFDALSRPLTVSVSGETTRRWIWGTSTAAHEVGRLKLTCVDSNAACTSALTSEGYVYDSIGRLSQKSIVADGGTYNYDYGYNAFGKFDTLTYPVSTSSYRLKLQYLYQNGMLQAVKDFNASTVFWQVNTMNARAEITQETLGNNVVTNRTFDPVTGWLSAINSGVSGGSTAQNESYLFDKVGNVTQRQNNNQGLTESFCYDDLYRMYRSTLTGVCASGTANLSVNFDAMGRITSRSDVASGATWTYHASKVHAPTQAGSASFTYTYDANGNAITRNGQTITWNKYNYPTLINNSASENVELSYDANMARWKQVYTNSGSAETTYYVGNLLEVVNSGGVTDYRHYIYSQDNTAAVAVISRTSTGTITPRYILEDHQQSPSNIRDASGALVVNESFSAFGVRRNWSSWSGGANSTELTTSANVTRQGYTWQTALGNMNLTHMNGRVQDAFTGVFLSADPTISEPGNTQNYNRYSYVYNNPLSLTDPSGFDACDWTIGYTGAWGTGSGINTTGSGRGLSNNVAAGLGGGGSPILTDASTGLDLCSGASCNRDYGTWVTVNGQRILNKSSLSNSQLGLIAETYALEYGHMKATTTVLLSKASARAVFDAELYKLTSEGSVNQKSWLQELFSPTVTFQYGWGVLFFDATGARWMGMPTYDMASRRGLAVGGVTSGDRSVVFANAALPSYNDNFGSQRLSAFDAMRFTILHELGHNSRGGGCVDEKCADEWALKRF